MKLRQQRKNFRYGLVAGWAPPRNGERRYNIHIGFGRSKVKTAIKFKMPEYNYATDHNITI